VYDIPTFKDIIEVIVDDKAIEEKITPEYVYADEINEDFWDHLAENP